MEQGLLLGQLNDQMIKKKVTTYTVLIEIFKKW